MFKISVIEKVIITSTDKIIIRILLLANIICLYHKYMFKRKNKEGLSAEYFN